MNFKSSWLFLFVFVGILTHEITADQPLLCLLPAKTGPCKASTIRYAYNSASGECEQFTYGGCDANGNNFKSMSECENTCKNV